MAVTNLTKQTRTDWAILDAAGSPVQKGSIPQQYGYLTRTWDVTVRRVRPELLALEPTTRSIGSVFLDPGLIDFETPAYAPLFRKDRQTGPVADPNLSAYNYFRDIGTAFKAINTATSGAQKPKRRVELEQLADLDVLIALKDQKINVMTTFAEGRKTLAWICGRAASAAAAYRAIRKGDVKSFLKQTHRSVPPPPRFLKRRGFETKTYEVVPRTPREVQEGFTKPFADRWLEFNYAALPAAYDVVGAAALLAEWYEDLPLTLPVKVQGKAAGYFEYPDRSRSLWRGISTPSAKPGVVLTAAGWEGSKVVVWYDVTRATLRAFARNGLLNVPSTALELVPYSFMLDWGVTMQAYLNALDAPLGTRFRAGYRVEFCNLHVKCDLKPNGSKVISYREPLGRALCVNRTKLTGFPTPVVVVKSPLSGAHVATTAALLANAIR